MMSRRQTSQHFEPTGESVDNAESAAEKAAREEELLEQTFREMEQRFKEEMGLEQPKEEAPPGSPGSPDSPG